MKSQEILANTIRLGPVHLRVVDIPASLPVGVTWSASRP